MKQSLWLAIAVLTKSTQALSAPASMPLSAAEVPEPPELDRYVRDRAAAVRLGKALYWDMQLGSDGVVACATCHFHAGADGRFKNQIKPVGGTYFHGGPNHTLSPSDFPFHALVDPDDASSRVLRDHPNRAVSQGISLFEFVDVVPGRAEEIGKRVPDPVFSIGGVNVRRPAAANAPTNLDAVFNFRQLVVAAAQEVFNGINEWGERKPNGRVFRNAGGRLEPVAVRIHNASLASQAMGPPTNASEMAFRGRTFPKIGKKMLSLVPLAKQRVARTDSVLGTLVRPSGRGLKVSYGDLIEQAFHPRWWNGRQILRFENDSFEIDRRPRRRLTTDEFTQKEANFSLFFGLSLLLYESTLVSDQTLYDRVLRKEARFTHAQARGFRIFRSVGCTSCHSGPELTAQSVANVTAAPIERMEMVEGPPSLTDVGVRNIGVRRFTDQAGTATVVDGVGPVSLARWAAEGHPVFDLDPPVRKDERTSAIEGAYKIPGLRNVELTGPYMHNGGMATLRQVVDFFNRGGNFFEYNKNSVDPAMRPLGLSEVEKCYLVEFLRTLTDPRVRRQQAPFDHPQLFIPNGHVGDETHVRDRGDGVAEDVLEAIPAVGRDGGTPLQTFLGLDPHDPGDGTTSVASGPPDGPRSCGRGKDEKTVEQ